MNRMTAAVGLLAIFASCGVDVPEAQVATSQSALAQSPGDLPPGTFEQDPIDQTHKPWPDYPNGGFTYTECDLMKDLCNARQEPPHVCQGIWVACAMKKSKGPPDAPGWP